MQKLTRKLDDFTKYLVAAVLLVVPLYPKFPFLRIPGTYVSIRLEDFLMLTVICTLVLYVLPDIKSFLDEKINKTILLFLLTGLVSLCSAIFITKTVQSHLGILHWVRRVEYFSPFFLGAIAIRKKRENLEFFLKVMVIVVLFNFVYGFGQRHFNWPMILTQNQEYAKGIAMHYVPGGHINATFAGHYDLATFLVLLLPIFISSLFLFRDLCTRVIIFVVVLSGLWLLACSGSRISIASYIVAASAALVLIRKYKAIPLVILVSLLFFVMSTSLVARYRELIEVGREKVQEMNRLFFEPHQGLIYAAPIPTPEPVFEDRSTSIRLNIEWPRAIRAFSKNPLLGTGYSSITLATDNDYLRLLGEMGILGFLTFFLIFLRIGKRVLELFPLTKNFRKLELAFVAGFVGALPGVFLNAVFIDVFEASKFAIIFWLLLGFTVALMKNE